MPAVRLSSGRGWFSRRLTFRGLLQLRVRRLHGESAFSVAPEPIWHGAKEAGLHGRSASRACSWPTKASWRHRRRIIDRRLWHGRRPRRCQGSHRSSSRRAESLGVIVPIRTYRYNRAWQEGRMSRRRRLGARPSLAIAGSALNGNRSQAQAWQRNSVPSSNTASTTG